MDNKPHLRQDFLHCQGSNPLCFQKPRTRPTLSVTSSVPPLVGMQTSFSISCCGAVAARVPVPQGGMALTGPRKAKAGVLNKPLCKLILSWLNSQFLCGVEGLLRAARQLVQLSAASCAHLVGELKLTETVWLCLS